MNAIAPNLKEGIYRNYKRSSKISCQDLIWILENRVQPTAMRSRNILTKLMAKGKHHNNIAHVTGSTDQTLHYTIHVNDRGYHLRLSKNKVIFMITGPDNKSLDGVNPGEQEGIYYPPQK